MARFRSLIFAIIGTLGVFANFVFDPILSIARNVGAFLVSAIEFRPDAGQSIAIDRAARAIDNRQPGIASRFANFIKRALTHDEFTAGHFDPGRMPA